MELINILFIIFFLSSFFNKNILENILLNADEMRQKFEREGLAAQGILLFFLVMKMVMFRIGF